MSVRVVVLLVPFVGLLVLAGWLWRWSRRRVGLGPELPRRSAELVGLRTAVGWRWAGLGLGALVAVETASLGSLGLGLMLAPTVFGICVIGGVVVGELATVPRLEGVRKAALETRTVGRYLPRRLGGLVAASTVGLGALLVTTTLMGSADDMGRAGRSLVRGCIAEVTGADGATQTGSSQGPWPGLFYSLPLGIAVAGGLLGAAVALHTVVRRPRRGSTSELVVADDALRRRSAEALVAATGVMVAPSLFGVALTAGGALIGIGCAPAAWTVLGFGLLVVAFLMFLLLAWCLALLLAGSRTRPLSAEGPVRSSGPVRL